VFKPSTIDIVKEFALLSLIKLYYKFRTHEKKILELIDTQKASPNVDVQQMSFEFIQLMKKE